MHRVCVPCLALCERDCVRSLRLIHHPGKGTEWVSVEILINPRPRSNPVLLDVRLPSCNCLGHLHQGRRFDLKIKYSILF